MKQYILAASAALSLMSGSSQTAHSARNDSSSSTIERGVLRKIEVALETNGNFVFSNGRIVSADEIRAMQDRAQAYWANQAAQKGEAVKTASAITVPSIQKEIAIFMKEYALTLEIDAEGRVVPQSRKELMQALYRDMRASGLMLIEDAVTDIEVRLEQLHLCGADTNAAHAYRNYLLSEYGDILWIIAQVRIDVPSDHDTDSSGRTHAVSTPPKKAPSVQTPMDAYNLLTTYFSTRENMDTPEWQDRFETQKTALIANVERSEQALKNWVCTHPVSHS